MNATGTAHDKDQLPIPVREVSLAPTHTHKKVTKNLEYLTHVFPDERIVLPAPLQEEERPRLTSHVLISVKGFRDR